ncbi:hypothetical protein ACROYT_G025824 [Oculina patagonica]
MKLLVATFACFVAAVASGPTSCNTCLSDAGSGDDLALCNAQQVSSNCSSPGEMIIGTTHCFTIAGRYESNNGSHVTKHTGIARGCANCSNTQAACEAAKTRFATLQNWTLLDCNIKCCTGDDCNTQNVTLLPLTSPATDPTTATTTAESHAGRHFLCNGVLAIAAWIVGAVFFF